MQRFHLRALMVFTVLLALAGCSTEQPKPAAVATPAKSAADTIINNPVLEARLTSEEDGRPEVGIGTLTPGSSVVTWLSDTEFYVQFDSDNNPCKDSGASPSRSYAYNSKLDASTQKYTVTCALKDKPAGQKKPLIFRYQIFAFSFPHKALRNPPKGHGRRPKHRSHDTGHCEGCVIVE